MKNSSLITSTEDVTTFSICILETGWIYDVFLILTDKIQSKYETHEFKQIKVTYTGKKIINNKTYSVFEIPYQFNEPSDFMVYFFIYTIEGLTYVTEHNCFAVKK